MASADGLFDKKIDIDVWSLISTRSRSGTQLSQTSQGSHDGVVGTGIATGIADAEDDLELSSWVEPSLIQCTVRSRRIFSMKKTLHQSKSNVALSTAS